MLCSSFSLASMHAKDVQPYLSEVPEILPKGFRDFGSNFLLEPFQRIFKVGVAITGYKRKKNPLRSHLLSLGSTTAFLLRMAVTQVTRVKLSWHTLENKNQHIK